MRTFLRRGFQAPVVAVAPGVSRPLTTCQMVGDKVSSIEEADVGATVTLRGRLQRSRVKGKKIGFLLLRQHPGDTIQAVVQGEELVAKAKGISAESILEVQGSLTKAATTVAGASVSGYELQLSSIETISAAATPLPFPVEDPNTKLDTRLDNRIMDLRTPIVANTMRVTSAVNKLFREHLDSLGFLEIHTPKTIATPSEGGSAVFQLSYFGSDAYLAQSPQLYKQMTLMGDAMRVMEIGPVFRAENSQTHRHATEYVGLDAELVIKESYVEVLDVLESTLVAICCGLEKDAAVARLRELLSEESVQAMNLADSEDGSLVQGGVGPCGTLPHPVVPQVSQETIDKLGIAEEAGKPSSSSSDKYGARVGPNRILRLSFPDAVRMLQQEGGVAEELDDFTTQQERQLGQLIKARYGVDMHIVDGWPPSARPFYTQLSADGTSSLSYDMYLRGEEISSGAQRIHDPTLLTQRAAEKGVNTTLIKDYVDSFRYGAWPHGGFGLGMERIVMLFLGLRDIRQVALFPRDPKRITP